MMLAAHGGDPAIPGPLKPFNTIGVEERIQLTRTIEKYPLSGFLGGELVGGKAVADLERRWSQLFKVKHAIACNSATSGLLAACAAAGIKNGDEVITTPYTMSATAAAPRLLGANIKFCDIDSYFCLDPVEVFRHVTRTTRAVIATNLFGHPAQLRAMRKEADKVGYYLIEDNAQAPFASEDGVYTGTIGHIGVFSLNVHKHIQCGEGGIIVTDDENLAKKMRLFINHGEMAGERVGLNLRMTELTAAVAMAQLTKSSMIVTERMNQAIRLNNIFGEIDWLEPAPVRPGCKHVFYTLPIAIRPEARISRPKFIELMKAEGLPLVAGYVAPLYRLKAFERFPARCQMAEAMHDRHLTYFENCGWSLTDEQIDGVKVALDKIQESLSDTGDSVHQRDKRVVDHHQA